ncbi:MAG: flagellar basal-body rod protein FlgF [Desulfatiglans sp.]|jgi:flagellar basal-body rod protein FlgG|nr:flagellar basal-body rod protein FlgF [Desulfatiglans sp.]
MINGMLESSRGCMKEEFRMDIISSNLSNINVIGFKKDRISFQNILDKTSMSANAPANVTIRPDMEQGDLNGTGNALDLAITGKGFFKVNTENGIRYTRKGNFTLDQDGMLTTQSGDKVMGKSGPIKITGENISIDRKGNIQTDDGIISQLDVVDFENYKGLSKEGKTFFINQFDEPEIELPTETAISQGYTELSNVNAADEMVNMIHATRAFESYQKAMRTIDDLNNQAINQVGKLR